MAWIKDERFVIDSNSNNGLSIFFSICRSTCKERENKLVYGDIINFSFEMLYLFFFLLLPFLLCFPTIKRHNGPLSSILYSSYNHGAGLARFRNKVIPILRSISSACHVQTLLSNASAWQREKGSKRKRRITSSKCSLLLSVRRILYKSLFSFMFQITHIYPLNLISHRKLL